MIDIKSLRLGNAVMYDGEIVFISSVLKTHVKISEYLNTLHCSKIDHIPLSEEILLKCGFEKDNICYFEKGNIKLEKLLTTPKFILRIKRGRTGSMEIKIVKYLHEIQNWYFLIHEEELQINL